MKSSRILSMERIKNILYNSALSHDERRLWIDHLSNLPDNYLENLASLLESDQSYLGLGTELLKNKIAMGNDPKKIEAFLRKEKELLEKSLE